MIQTHNYIVIEAMILYKKIILIKKVVYYIKKIILIKKVVLLSENKFDIILKNYFNIKT
jgi:hypothetical protein